MHEHTFALKLLYRNQVARLTDFRMTLSPPLDRPNMSIICLAGVRLIGWHPGDYCNQSNGQG
jgi:hypothetical protein